MDGGLSPINILPSLPGPTHGMLAGPNVTTPEGEKDSTSKWNYNSVNLQKDFDGSDEDDDASSMAANNNEEGMEEPRPFLTIEQMHQTFIRREEERALMRRLYHEGKGLQKSDDITWSIKRSLKERIFPKVKILSDREHNFIAPNFVDDDCADQSRVIAEILIGDLNLPQSLEYKVQFWVTYRSLIKNQLVKYRSNCVEEIKNVYLRGVYESVLFAFY
jgi:hypothetical protein